MKKDVYLYKKRKTIFKINFIQIENEAEELTLFIFGKHPNPMSQGIFSWLVKNESIMQYSPPPHL